MRIVQKYGGSSVATTEKIKNIANYIVKNFSKEDEIVIVLSAMGKTTNNLLSLISEITDNPSKREQDALISTGEIISASLLSIALNNLGRPAISLTGFQAGIRTDNFYSRAFIESIEPDRLNLELSKGNVVIVTGFQGIDKFGNITTLGRGGSDTSAVALAAVLSCPCEIYTDVDAVYGVDPRIYSKAKPIHKISYEEMMEMSVHGAKVLETRCIELAKKYKVPLYLGRTLELNKNKGTYVMNRPVTYFEQMIISGLTAKDEYKVCSVKLNNFNELSIVLNLLSKTNINYEMINEIAFENLIYFSFGSTSSDIVNVKNKLSEFNINSSLTDNYTKLTLTGTGFSTHTKAVSSLFELLTKNNINFEKISITEMSASFLIDTKNKDEVINLISKKFNL